MGARLHFRGTDCWRQTDNGLCSTRIVTRNICCTHFSSILIFTNLFIFRLFPVDRWWWRRQRPTTDRQLHRECVNAKECLKMNWQTIEKCAQSNYRFIASTRTQIKMYIIQMAFVMFARWCCGRCRRHRCRLQWNWRAAPSPFQHPSRQKDWDEKRESERAR